MSATAGELHRPVQQSGLIRALGLWPATSIVISDIIGTGIFLVTSDMARAVGSATMVFAAWILGGLIVLFGALCFAELGAALPKAGGRYVYLSRGLGPLSGFLFGWTVSFVLRPASMATLAAGFLRFLAFLFPAIAHPLSTFHVGRYEYVFTVAQPLAVVVVLVVAGINIFSVRVGGVIQVLLGMLKVGVIVLIVIAGLLFAKPGANETARQMNPLGLGTVPALLTALVSVMWAYNGFQDLGELGEEIVRPEKNIPRAIVLGLVIVATLYLMANVVYFHVLPFAQIAESQHVASDVVRSFAGSSGARWLTIAMAVSAVGALHVTLLTGARVTYAMARDRVFLQFAKRIHSSFHTPVGAVALLAFVASVLALSGTFEELYSLFVFAEWIFLALTAIALVRLRRKEPRLPRPYRTLAYPWTPFIFLVAALALTINLWIARPVRSSLGLAVILAGIPFFYRWRNRLS